MSRYQEKNTYFQNIFILASIAASVISILIIYLKLSKSLATQAIYIPIGLIIVVFLLNDTKMEIRSINISSINLTKIQLILYLVLFSGIFLTKNRILILIIFSALSTVLLILRYITQNRFHSLFLHSLLLASFFPLAKIMKAGKYFGGTDILLHSRFAKQLVDSGSVSAISAGYSMYPIYHILVGIVNLISNITTFNSVNILGVIIYLLSIVFIFVVLKNIVSKKVRFYTCVSFSLITSYSYFSSYFIPQSMEIFNIILICYFLKLISSKYVPDSSRKHLALKSFIVFMVLISVLTHHYSIALTLPISIAYVLFVLSYSKLAKNNYEYKHITINMINGYYILLIISALSYWAYIGDDFIYGITFASVGVFTNLGNGLILTSGPSNSTNIINLGAKIIESSPSIDILWLITPDGIYNITLLSFYTVSVLWLIKTDISGKNKSFLLIFGAFVGALNIKSPVAIKSLNRIIYLWSPIFAILLGQGLGKLSSDRKSNIIKPVFFTVLLLFSVAAPLAVSDDLPQLRPDNPARNQQVKYSSGEYTSIKYTSQFSKQYVGGMESFWLSKRTFFHFGSKINSVQNVNSSGIYTSSRALYYRTSWNHHFVTRSLQVYLQKIYMGRDFMDNNIKQNNKIYSSGYSGIIWNREKVTFRNNATHEKQ